MKKLLTALLMLCLVLSLPQPALAAESGTCGEGLSWILENGTLTISGSGAMDDFPDGAPWAAFSSSITTVVIGDGVTYIGACAFKDFDALRTVHFGADVTELGECAFYSCDGLTSLSMPAAFKIFGKSSLESCSSLQSIVCAGRCPTFRSNSVWNTSLTIYFPVERPWAREDVEQLEEAFHNRIRFLASDGSDPYKTPEAPVETPEETTAPTEITVPTETTAPAETEPAAIPSAIPTATQTITSATPAQSHTTGSSGDPEPTPADKRIFLMLGLLGVAILAAVAAILLLLRQTKRHKRRRRST